MRKISKKDRVRQFTNPVWMLRLLAVFMCSNVVSVTFSQDAIEKSPAYMDSVEISLLTCSPHEEIYSLYGHTALRCHDLHAGMEQDMVLNWGGEYELMFTFAKEDIQELQATGVPFSIIGLITNDDGAYLLKNEDKRRLDYGRY